MPKMVGVTILIYEIIPFFIGKYFIYALILLRRFKPNNVPTATRHALNPIIATLFDAVFGNFSPCTTGFATSF